MKAILAITAGLLVGFAVPSSAQSLLHVWSKNFGGTDYHPVYAIAVDGSGNVVLTGTFEGTVDFGGGNLVSAGYNDVFVAKYNPSGVHQWSQRFGGTLGENGGGVAVDGSGNVVVTGLFQDTANFGGGNLVSAGNNEIYLAKYDANGVHQWSKRLGGVGHDEGWTVAADGSGNIVVTGYFEGTVDFGGGPLASAGTYDNFVATYDASGGHQWSKSFGSTGYALAEDAIADGSGNVVVTGRFTGDVDFGGGNFTSAGDEDIFLVKYDASGVHQWSKRFGSMTGDIGYGVAFDGSGNVVATGMFSGTANFGGGNLVSVDDSGDIYLAKYNASGVHQWSNRLGSWGSDEGDAIAVVGSGTVVVSGLFEGAVNFGGGNLVSAEVPDIFLAKYLEEGTIPVLISRFDATPRPGGIELAWEFSSDEAVDGFTLYRGRGQSSSVVIATGDAQSTRSYTDVSVEPGETYQYELVIRTASRDEFRSPIATATVPAAVTTLAQNFPNPFNPQTTIEYTVSAPAPVSIEIFDASGALVRVLDQGVREAGSYRAEWDGRDAANQSVSSGVYFYRLLGVKSAETRKMVLVK